MTPARLRIPLSLALGLLVIFASLATGVILYFGTSAIDILTRGSVDSEGYIALGEAIWNGTEIPGGRFGQRGYLFATVTTGLLGISPILLIAFQTFAIGTGTVFLARSETQLAGNIRFSPLVILSVSLLLSPFHLMTEALAYFAGAAALMLLLRERNRQWGFLALAIAALVKPAFLPILILCGLTELRLNVRSGVVLALAIIVIAPQLIGSHIVDGKPAFSTAGASNFQERFYPAVVGQQEQGIFVGYNTSEAARYAAQRPNLDEQIGYVILHPGATFRAWYGILWTHHLRQASGYVQNDNKVANIAPRLVLKKYGANLNLIFLIALIPTVFGVLGYLRSHPFRQWSPALLGPSLIVSAPLVYWQGDRIVFLGLLLSLPFAGLGFQMSVTWLKNLATTSDHIPRG